MKYLSADLLPKVFHGLILVLYIQYTYNCYSQPKQAVFFRQELQPSNYLTIC
jgi:hypothetical protein